MGTRPVIALVIFVVIFTIYLIISHSTPNYIIIAGYSNKLNKTEREFLIPPFVQIPAYYTLAPKYNLTGCIVPKAMSQLTINTLCYLFDKDLFLRSNQSMRDATLISRRSCWKDSAFTIFGEKQKRNPYMRRFAFIRDPFDRFLSFYLNKCVNDKYCWNCKGDMRCVVKNVYESLKKLAKREIWSTPSFEDFHTAPLTWSCDFAKDIDKFDIILIGLETAQKTAAISKLAQIFREQFVPEADIQYIIQEATQSETTHSTHSSPLRKVAEEQLKRDNFVRQYLHRIYFYDYGVFQLNREHLDPEYR
ncbi:unnamed protein product [Caenorhabditis bovis]|uniref:Sulfotransferase domain-containing protein n=1 Tax=Caenorhabditis bovis TaxID=2654633 RepID=A0A8S1F6U1_9PELO|nr:unnamed protein product [Caenorhabditis bovis]